MAVKKCESVFKYKKKYLKQAFKGAGGSDARGFPFAMAKPPPQKSKLLRDNMAWGRVGRRHTGWRMGRGWIIRGCRKQQAMGLLLRAFISHRFSICQPLPTGVPHPPSLMSKEHQKCQGQKWDSAGEKCSTQSLFTSHTIYAFPSKAIVELGLNDAQYHSTHKKMRKKKRHACDRG